MKRFLVSMAVSITFITIGFTSIFFEFHKYEIVDYTNDDRTPISDTLKVSDVIKNDKIMIELDGSYLYVDILDDLKDDSVIVIDYPSHVRTEIKDTILLEGGSYSSHSYSYRRFKDLADIFVDGLKDGKIYVNIGEESNRIVVHCSPNMRNKIRVQHD